MDSIVRTNPEHFSTLGRAFPRSNPAPPSLTIFLFMNNNNNIIERKGQNPCTKGVYKRIEYPKDYCNLKNKSNLPDSLSQN
jgi:hypothetical protein